MSTPLERLDCNEREISRIRTFFTTLPCQRQRQCLFLFFHFRVATASELLCSFAAALVNVDVARPSLIVAVWLPCELHRRHGK